MAFLRFICPLFYAFLFFSTGNALAENSSLLKAKIPPEIYGEWDVIGQFDASEKIIGKLLLFENKYAFKTALKESDLDKYVRSYTPTPPFMNEREGGIVLEHGSVIRFGETQRGLSYFFRTEQKEGMMQLHSNFSAMLNPLILKRIK